MTALSRRICKKLRICWHGLVKGVFGEFYECACGLQFDSEDGIVAHLLDNHNFNPDFTDDAGAVQLLRIMGEREDGYEFISFIGGEVEFNKNGTVWKKNIPADFITTHGALAKAAYEFLPDIIKEAINEKKFI